MAAPKPVRAMNPDRIKIFTGSANPALAEELCRCLGISLGKASLRQFADGESVGRADAGSRPTSGGNPTRST